MKNNKIIIYITTNGIIASLYIVLSLFLGSLSFGTNGIFEIRISEILMLFAFISPFYFPGLIIGCFLTNLLGSAMPLDFIVGTLQTALACLILYFLKNHKQIGIVLASLTCGIMIGLELYFLGFSSIGLWIMASIFLGELIALELGFIVYKILMKNSFFKKIVY